MADQSRASGLAAFRRLQPAFRAGEFEEALQAARRVNMRELLLDALRDRGGVRAARPHRRKARRRTTPWSASRRPLGDKAHLREFVRRWYWSEEMIESLLEGVQRSFDAVRLGRTSVDVGRRRLRSGQVDRVDRRAAVHRSQREEGSGLVLRRHRRRNPERAGAAAGPARRGARVGVLAPRQDRRSARSIGEKLNVTTVLEGSVRRAGDRVRITAQLSDARAGPAAVVGAFRSRAERHLRRAGRDRARDCRAAAGDDRRRIRAAGAADHDRTCEAYELLLKGRVFVTRRGRGGRSTRSAVSSGRSRSIRTWPKRTRCSVTRIGCSGTLRR